MTSHNTRHHALGHTRGWYTPLKAKEVPYTPGVVPQLWLKASSYRSLAGKVHGQLESALEGTLARQASSPMDVRVLTLSAICTVSSYIVYTFIQPTAAQAIVYITTV